MKGANWAIIRINGVGTFLQSYSTIIAAKTPDGVFLDRDKWDYSATTNKHRCDFLDEYIAETRKKIKSGEYTLIDLNP